MKTGRFPCFFALMLLVLASATAAAQQFDFGQLGGPGGFGGLGGGEQVTIAARFVTAPGAKTGQLQVTATIEPGWHIYSITQPKGGTMPTSIKVAPSETYQVLGKFQADQPPKIKETEIYSVPLEEHYGVVTWTAPIQLADDVDPSQVEIPVTVSLQVCDEASTCIPKIGDDALKATAAYAGEQEGLSVPPTTGQDVEPLPEAKYVTASAKQPFSDTKWNINFHGEITPSVVPPGGVAQLKFTAHSQGDYHIYAWAAGQSPLPKPTRLGVELPEGWTATEPVPSKSPHVEPAQYKGGPELVYHEGEITWTIEIHVPEGAAPGPFEITGAAAFHTCTPSQCDPPTGLLFRVPVTVGAVARAAAAPLQFSLISADDPYKFAAQRVAAIRESVAASDTGPIPSAALDFDKIEVQDSSQEYSLWLIVVIAVAGGFILNFMPCVWPVIGLKVMSFVQQAGGSRVKVFTLNMWYVLGIMIVFWVLATLLVVWNVGSGDFFSDNAFRITMLAVIFAMALSFLGVWEIPIPGFAGSGKAAEAAEREGPSGAVFKGMLTTVLATPCLGPGLGTALAWCNGQPTPIVYLIFSALGLGMSLPYIAIGIYPKLIGFLPKPGAWMDTFKQIMGFMLLGTVVFFFTFLSAEYFVPTLALLFGIWAGVWWIGRVPIYAELHTKIRSWAVGAGIAALVGILSFNLLLTGDSEIAWEPYSEARLEQLASQNRTVMIDFTADWCVTCKFLEKTVLDTNAVRAQLERNGVETLLADWTDGDAEIKRMLNRLGSNGVPVLAIFPAGRPYEPIVLKDGYTKDILLRKLKEAGPSQATPGREDVAEALQPVRGA